MTELRISALIVFGAHNCVTCHPVGVFLPLQTERDAYAPGAPDKSKRSVTLEGSLCQRKRGEMLRTTKHDMACLWR